MIRQSIIKLRRNINIVSLRMKLSQKLVKPMKAIKTICLIAKLIPITKTFGNASRSCVRIILE